jgi:hypothetical protein
MLRDRISDAIDSITNRSTPVDYSLQSGYARPESRRNEGYSLRDIFGDFGGRKPIRVPLPASAPQDEAPARTVRNSDRSNSPAWSTWLNSKDQRSSVPSSAPETRRVPSEPPAGNVEVHRHRELSLRSLFGFSDDTAETEPGERAAEPGKTSQPSPIVHLSQTPDSSDPPISDQSWKSLEEVGNPDTPLEKYPTAKKLSGDMDEISIDMLADLAEIQTDVDKQSALSRQVQLENELFIVQTKLAVFDKSEAQLQEEIKSLKEQTAEINRASDDLAKTLDRENEKYELWSRVLKRFKAGDLIGAATVLSLIDKTLAAAKDEYEQAWNEYSGRLIDGREVGSGGMNQQAIAKLGKHLQESRARLRVLAEERLKDGVYRQLENLMKVSYAYGHLQSEKLKSERGVLLRQAPRLRGAEKKAAQDELLKRQTGLQNTLSELSNQITPVQRRLFEISQVLDLR